MSFAENFAAKKDARAILLDYRPFNEANRLGDVRQVLERAGIGFHPQDVLDYDRFDPSQFSARLLARLEQHDSERVIVDISTMSKLAIMLILEVCRKRNVAIRVIYSEAKSYGPSRSEFVSARNGDMIRRPSLHGFTGVHGVVRVDSLASVAMQGQPTAAIVFMSFNNALTQLLLNTVYPGRLFLINGRPPVHKWREAATAWVHDQVRREWEEDNPVYRTKDRRTSLVRTVSTLDYRESVRMLIDLYWQLSATHRILLAPSGSKMQTVACHLIKALHPDIHIEYPSPEGFAREYSTGIGTRWLVDFGRPSDLLTAIRNLETRTYLAIAD